MTQGIAEGKRLLLGTRRLKWKTMNRTLKLFMPSPFKSKGLEYGVLTTVVKESTIKTENSQGKACGICGKQHVLCCLEYAED